MSETYNLLLHFKNKLQKTSFSAGKEIMKYHNKLSCIDKKNDNSPVTKADELAEEIILNDLYKLDTKLPVIAEEDSYKNILILILSQSLGVVICSVLEIFFYFLYSLKV